MTSDLSIFAARLRDFIAICEDEPTFGVSSRPGAESPAVESALQAHYDAEFNGMALVLFALQFTHNPAYRKFCEARQVCPDAVNHWTQIPAMPAAAFKELDLTSLPPAERTAVFHSSGTTEQRRSRHFHSAESLAIYEASLWPWFCRHVLPDKLKLELQPGRTSAGVQASACSPCSEHFQLAILTPPPASAPHSSLVHMFEIVRRQLGAPGSAFLGSVAGDGAWVLNFDAALSGLRTAEERKCPLILPGTAFSFVHLLDQLAEQDLRFTLPPGSRVMETGGYKGRSRTLPKPELHSLITERLGIPADYIICEYGMSELSSQAYDQRYPALNSQLSTRNPERTFHFPPWARAQIISPETGDAVDDNETGLLRIFDLANVFSVLAVQTEDLAVRRGTGFELIGRATAAEPRGCSLMTHDA